MLKHFPMAKDKIWNIKYTIRNTNIMISFPMHFVLLTQFTIVLNLNPLARKSLETLIIKIYMYYVLLTYQTRKKRNTRFLGKITVYGIGEHDKIKFLG